MHEMFNAVPVTENVYWVGAIDWNLRDFHGYSTDRGSTYNAYLILGDVITLIDTVKAPFLPEMLARIASVCDVTDIRYIVSNHAEMDHSGGLPNVIERAKPEKVLASANGVKALTAHFGPLEGLAAVQDGESLALGDFTLSFYETRMLHWPDSMVTLFAEDRILFSQDAFGMHLASSERFADEIDPSILESEAAKYFANILLPFAPLILRAAEKLSALDFAIIAPDHGPIWRKDTGTVLGWYARWAQQQRIAKAVIMYDTMWESTDTMAQAIADGAADGGLDVKLMRLRENARSDVATELLDAGALVVGSPTMNNQLFPTVADAMTYLRGLKPKNLLGAAFGSYGWSGEAVTILDETLDAMKIERITDGLKAHYVPTGDVLAQCRQLGQQIAQAVIQRWAD